MSCGNSSIHLSLCEIYTVCRIHVVEKMGTAKCILKQHQGSRKLRKLDSVAKNDLSQSSTIEGEYQRTVH